VAKQVSANMFKRVVKYCLECNRTLQLNNTRDIERKKFCSKVCRAKFNGKKLDMTKLWDKNNTPEINAKKGHKREKHFKWIEDRSLLKNRPRPEKNEWRNAVFTKDKFTCKQCFKNGGLLEAHHKAPYSLFPKLRETVENGITLCKTCHKLTHRAFSELFGGVNSKHHKQGEYFASSK